MPTRPAAALCSALKWDEAEAAFVEAMRLDPENYLAADGLADVSISKGRLDEALTRLEKAVELGPQTATALNRRSMVWVFKGELERAVSDCDAAIAIDPENVQAFVTRSTCQFALKREQLAFNDINEAIRLDPLLSQGFEQRAIMWYARKDYVKAFADLDAGLKVDPRRLQSRSIRAHVLLDMCRDDEALETIGGLIKDVEGPDAISARRDVSLRWETDGIPGQSASLDSTPHKVNIGMYYRLRGVILERKQDFDVALRDYERALEIKPDDARALAYKAGIQMRQSEFQQARDNFEEAIRLSPKDDRVQMTFAEFLATCPEQEWRDGRRALELATASCATQMWRDVSTLEALAAAYAEVGNFDEASQWQLCAVAHAQREAEPRLRERLELYRSGKPFRFRIVAHDAIQAR
jgi:tetratricopeptide (TPR) repeat protein